MSEAERIKQKTLRVLYSCGDIYPFQWKVSARRDDKLKAAGVYLELAITRIKEIEPR